MVKLILVLALVAFVTTSSASFCDQLDVNETLISDGLYKIQILNQRMNFKALQGLSKDSGKSSLWSTEPVANVLGILSLHAKDSNVSDYYLSILNMTKEQIKPTFRVENILASHRAGWLWSGVVYVDKTLVLLDDAINTLYLDFHATTAKVDYSDQSETANKINDWTRQMLPHASSTVEVLNEGDIPINKTTPIMVGTGHYSARWMYPPVETTLNASDGSSTQLSAMKMRGKMLFFENEDYWVAGLHQETTKENVYILKLKENESDYSDMMKNLSDSEYFYDLYNKMVYANLEITVPKVQYTQSIDLCSEFWQMYEQPESIRDQKYVNAATIETDLPGVYEVMSINLDTGVSSNQCSDELCTCTSPIVLDARPPFLMSVAYDKNMYISGLIQNDACIQAV